MQLFIPLFSSTGILLHCQYLPTGLSAVGMTANTQYNIIKWRRQRTIGNH